MAGVCLLKSRLLNWPGLAYLFLFISNILEARQMINNNNKHTHTHSQIRTDTPEYYISCHILHKTHIYTHF